MLMESKRQCEKVHLYTGQLSQDTVAQGIYKRPGASGILFGNQSQDIRLVITQGH